MKKRNDQLEIFFFNFSIFSKKIFQKEITDFDDDIFIKLEEYINNLKEQNSNNKNYVSIIEHHQILKRLNIKINELIDKNRSFQYL